MNDKRIGNTTDGSEPEVCAVSGEPVQGRHNVQHMLGSKGHFCRVLNKREEGWNETLKTELMQAVAAETAPIKSDTMKKKEVSDVRSE